jgi:hypothetical protein
LHLFYSLNFEPKPKFSVSVESIFQYFLNIRLVLFFLREFENCAIGVLNVFDKHTSGSVSDVIFLRYDKYLKMDYLELAIQSRCKNFVADDIVQSILNDIWSGKQIEYDSLVSFYA